MAEHTQDCDLIGQRITSIDVVVRDPNLRRVRIGKSTAAVLPAREIESLNLKAGAMWSQNLAAMVETRLQFERGLRIALRRLGHRALSSRQIADHLKERGLAEGVVQRVLDHLRKHGWIDDNAFAATLARELIEKRCHGLGMVIEKLTARGIDPALAEEVARRAFAATDSPALIADFARKKAAAMQHIDKQIRARRITTALERRGHDEDAIMNALHETGLAGDAD